MIRIALPIIDHHIGRWSSSTFPKPSLIHRSLINQAMNRMGACPHSSAVVSSCLAALPLIREYSPEILRAGICLWKMNDITVR